MNQPDNPSPDPPNREQRLEPRGQQQKPWKRVAGMGIELAGAVLVTMLIGYWINRWLGGDGKMGIALGGLLGFAFGMFRFVQKAMQAARNQSN